MGFELLRKQFVIALLLAAVLFFGCIGEQPPQPEENKTNVTPPVVPPSFIIIGPTQDEVIKANEQTAVVDVVLTTQNLLIKKSGAKKIGEGHFIFSLDNKEKMAVYQKIASIENVALGEHTLTIELVHNDGSSYNPKIVRSVRFIVEKENAAYIPAEYNVMIKDFMYEPAELTVNRGDKVIWTNSGMYPRSATCSGLFDTGMIGPGDNAAVVMQKAGECDYISMNLPTMKAHIKINEVD